VILVSDLYAQMEPKTFRRFMCEEGKRDYKDFLGEVTPLRAAGHTPGLERGTRAVSRAVPHRAAGRRRALRIISGYNPQTREIIYTDHLGRRAREQAHAHGQTPGP